jgi:reactive intermediate/imine deaminase
LTAHDAGATIGRIWRALIEEENRAMAKVPIVPEGMAAPIAPYSWATKAGNLVFVAGQAALGSDGAIVGEGDIRRQTEQTMENIKRTLEAAGATMDDVVKTTIYLTDVANYAGMNEVYRRYFSGAPPARATLLTGLVVEGLLVEIEAIALIEQDGAVA